MCFVIIFGRKYGEGIVPAIAGKVVRMISWWCYNINIIDILLRDVNVFKSLFNAITGTGTTIRRTTDFWDNKKTVVHNFQYFFQINSRKGQKVLTLALLIRASLLPSHRLCSLNIGGGFFCFTMLFNEPASRHKNSTSRGTRKPHAGLTQRGAFSASPFY